MKYFVLSTFYKISLIKKVLSSKYLVVTEAGFALKWVRQEKYAL